MPTGAAAGRDIVRGLFLCFALAAILNLIFVLNGSPVIADYGSTGKVAIGYSGYFTGKNLLGEFAAIALLLAFHEVLYSGVRRAFGIIIVIIAISLLFLANSKTALGFALFAPVLAGLTLIAGKKTRISMAIILSSIPLFYIVLSSVSGFNMNRISYILYGDSTFTGRTLIWDFAELEIARRPFFGMGIPRLLARRRRRSQHR